MKNKQKLVFLDRWSTRNMGASVMRVHQLSQHMRRFHGDSYDISVVYISRSAKNLSRAFLRLRFPGAVFFFSKYAASGWGPDDFERVQKSARATLIDYVDGSLDNVIHRGVDGHIASTFEGARQVKAVLQNNASGDDSLSGEVFTALHNYDSRLDAFINQRAQSNRMNMCYLGTAFETVKTTEVEQEVTFLNGANPSEFEKSLRHVSQFNCHYGVRRDLLPTGPQVVKPFTKGATAAACASPILVNHATHDAAEQLGSDYPFLIKDNKSDTIAEGLRHMKESFGGREWEQAVERMRSLHELTSHRNIAAQLHSAIQTFL